MRLFGGSAHQVYIYIYISLAGLKAECNKKKSKRNEYATDLESNGIAHRTAAAIWSKIVNMQSAKFYFIIARPPLFRSAFVRLRHSSHISSDNNLFAIFASSANDSMKTAARHYLHFACTQKWYVIDGRDIVFACIQLVLARFCCCWAPSRPTNSMRNFALWTVVCRRCARLSKRTNFFVSGSRTKIFIISWKCYDDAIKGILLYNSVQHIQQTRHLFCLLVLMQRLLLPSSATFLLHFSFCGSRESCSLSIRILNAIWFWPVIIL